MVNQSYDDPVKQKWRDAWYRFIKKNKHHLNGNSRTWNIAFFPGEEALELNVYDRLKIPRENLLGLEIDPKSHEKLKKKGLGIRLTEQPIDALDFFKTTNETFDIINLDYKSTFNWNVRDTLVEIPKRNLLEDKSILGLTIYNKRDSSYLSEVADKTFMASKGLQEEFGRFKEKFPEISTTEYLKDNGYTRRQIKNETILNGILAFTNYSFMRDMEKLHGHLYQQLREKGINEEESSYIAQLILKSKNKPNSLKAMERYEYVSKNASLMFADFFKFSKDIDSLKKYQPFIATPFDQLDAKEIIESILGRKIKSRSDGIKLWKIVCRDLVINKGLPQIPKRVHLGSSAKLPKLTGEEYYNQRYEDDKKEISVEGTHERLIQNFKITPRQLSAFEAHYTMETHGPKYVHLETPEETKEISKKTLEKKLLHKNQLITSRVWKRLSKNKKRRIEYFINEDLQRLNLNEEQLNQFAQNINESRWYNENNNIQDSQFYAFFNDLLLESINNGVPSSKRVNTLYENVKRPNWKTNYPRTIKPLLTLKKYKQLRIEDGKEDEWILKNYRTEKPNSLRAYKAWVTINNKKKMANPTNTSPNIYVDSRGIVHRNPSNISQIEKGYR